MKCVPSQTAKEGIYHIITHLVTSKRITVYVMILKKLYLFMRLSNSKFIKSAEGNYHYRRLFLAVLCSLGEALILMNVLNVLFF